MEKSLHLSPSSGATQSAKTGEQKFLMDTTKEIPNRL